MSNEKRITKGSKALANGHVVSYVQTSYVGWFAKVDMTTTDYECNCGKVYNTHSRFLTRELNFHDTWKTRAERIAAAADFQAYMTKILGEAAANV
jgi:hypothetical protein